ncbi:DivIVA domain-containing protein [Vagococcus sp. PNs007]|uniref:DivIVA domain-containing protein n=1 Tax=Vagococcus proximus TaxID=2991417 RepID=A0ABT5X0F5_9ENTE|nr:DivIVA domain-containing protein [Vagococcus proximus]MDF0479436.1 DivIVA domain-containing protein [Vagococcus proximus]
MALSPIDIKNKTFSNKMRGYNQDEVDDFLDQIIEDFEATLREKKETEKALKHANEKLTYFNELKDALNQSIIVAQDTADKLKDSAEKESELTLNTANSTSAEILRRSNEEAETTVSEAKRKANEIITNAQTRATVLAKETDELKTKTKEFHRKLSLMLESQLEIVNAKDWDSLLLPFSAYIGEDHQEVKKVLDNEAKKTENKAPETAAEAVLTEEKVEVKDNATKEVEVKADKVVETVKEETKTDSIKEEEKKEVKGSKAMQEAMNLNRKNRKKV